MRTVIFELIPLVIGAAIVPLGVVVTLLLLRGRKGLVRAIAFTAGGMVVQLAQGLIFGYLLRGAATPGGNWLAPILLLLAGIVLLSSLALTWRGSAKSDTHPKWLTSLQEARARSAFGVGTLLMFLAIKQWAFILSALGVIGEAQLGWTLSVIIYLGFVVAANWLLLVPVILSAVIPDTARRLLDIAHRWMERNNRGITVVVALTFGLWFLWQGIAGLIAVHNPPVISMVLARK
jgi:hypothetical protein